MKKSGLGSGGGLMGMGGRKMGIWMWIWEEGGEKRE